MILGQVDRVGNSLSSWTLNNGLATVLLFMFVISIGLAIWKLMRWGAVKVDWLTVNVVMPMKDAFIGHLKHTDNTMEAMQNALEGMNSKHERIEIKIDELLQKNR